MSFLHTVKIFFSNFALCYKTLLYKLIALILAASIVATFTYTPITNLYNLGGFDGLITMFKAKSIGEFFLLSKTAIENFSTVFNIASSSTRTAIVLGIITFVLLFGFLYNLDKVPKAEVISSKMNSNLRLGYTGQFFRRIGHSALFSLVNLLYFIISSAIIVLIYIFLLNVLYINSAVSILAPFIIFVVLALLISFASSVFGTHAASCVLNECGIFSGLFKGIATNFKSFFKVFSLNLGIVVLGILINVFASLISAGALLILTIPCTIVFYDVLNMTICYNQHGNRYYLDSQTIITPRQNESFDKVKNLIDLI